MAAARQTDWSPTNPDERLLTLDILRGFALLGILVVNMAHFSSPYVYLQLAGLEWWTGTVDQIVQAMIRFLAEGKFISMFSFLFGLGTAMQMQKAAARGVRFPTHFTRRLLVLLMFGLLHGVLVWMGDILTFYALMGFVLLILRYRAPRTLLVLAGVAIAFPVLLTASFWVMFSFASLSPDAAAGLQQQMMGQQRFFEGHVTQAIAIYPTGTFAEVTVQRLNDFGLMASFAPFWLAIPLAMLLLGLYAGRMGLHADIEGHLPLIRTVTRWGLGLGLVGNAFYTGVVAAGVDPTGGSGVGVVAVLAQSVGQPALAIFYLGGFTLLCRQEEWRGRMQRFAAVGRMPLTNYLFQSLVATLIFYGYGFGLYGQIGPAAGLLITAGIFTVQLWLSPFWAKRFRYGPMEWLWRLGTYGTLPPMRLDEKWLARGTLEAEVMGVPQWTYEGDAVQGLIVGDGETYPYQVTDGQVRVELPFAVDQERMRELLTEDHWAVALDHDDLDSQAWGPEYDVDGYYPCWLWEESDGQTILAFPPQDYRVTDPKEQGVLVAFRPEEDAGERTEVTVEHEPVFGPRSVAEFSRWIGYAQGARRD